MSENSLFFTKNTSIRYICFNVKIRFNNLISEQNPNKFSEKQYSRYRLIKTLHENGLGYRRISSYLNNKNLKTTRTNNSYTPKLIWMTLKKYKIRLLRNKDNIIQVKECLYVTPLNEINY